MAFKRLIAMVPVKDGQVVLSYGYAQHRPAGGIDTVLKNLDRWGVDEIVVIDITRGRRMPDYDLLDRIRRSRVRTPVAFGGGIRSAEHALRVVALGCDRVVLETLLWQSAEEVARISAEIGQQAVIGSAPVHVSETGLQARRAGGGPDCTWSEFERRLEDCPISELLVIDHRQEGGRKGLDVNPALPMRSCGPKLIWFGGIQPEQVSALLQRDDTVAVAFGNPFLRGELAASAVRRWQRQVGPQGLLREVKPHA